MALLFYFKEEFMAYTPEEQTKVDLVRLLTGTGPSSALFELRTDDDIASVLVMQNWNVVKASKWVALGVAAEVSAWNYRERVGEEDVWSNIGRDYQGFVKTLLAELGNDIASMNISPYVGGVSLSDWVSNCRNPDIIRSKLSKINSCCDNRLGYLLGLGTIFAPEDDCPC